MSTSKSSVQYSSNANARALVQMQQEFNGSNTYARTHHATDQRPTDLYIVYSYGNHYPMFIAETFDGITSWYENDDRYSVTTSKHKSQLRPTTNTTKLNTTDMLRMSAHGIAGVVTQKGAGYGF